MAGIGDLVARLFRTRAWRANARMGQSRANILSAGIAFFGVFSIFPLMILGFTVFGQVLRRNEQLQDQLFAYLDGALPGLVGNREGEGLIQRQTLFDQALDPTTLGLTAAIGAGALLFTALGWIAALREGIRGVNLMPPMQVDPVRAKLFDLVVALTLGVLLVSSALFGVVTNAATDQLVGLLGLDPDGAAPVLTPVLVFLTTAVIDTLVFMMLYRVLAGVRRPWRQLLSGSVLAAVGVGVLRLLATQLLGGLDGRFGFLGAAVVPVLALFVWLNLTARVMLLGAAWVAVGPRPEDTYDVTEVPERVALPPRPGPVLPERWTDRAVLGAGVVLGATAVGLARVSLGAARAAGAGVRSMVRGDGPSDR